MRALFTKLSMMVHSVQQQKRTRTLFTNVGLQLPESLLRDGSFGNAISHENETVKTKIFLKSPQEGIRDLAEVLTG